MDLMPVEDLRQRKQELMPSKKISSQLTQVASVFDPRPPSFRSHVPEASEQLRCSLMALNQPCAFLHVLVPDVGVINHDHSYSLDPALLEEERTISTTPVTVSTEYTTRILDDATVATVKDNLQVSSLERQHTEEDTRKQSSSSEWFLLRAQRITSSICGLILTQKKKSVPLLKRCLYPKPLFDPFPLQLPGGGRTRALQAEST